MAQPIAELEQILSSATEDLPNLSAKKMFGCQAFWANGNVFALVWKQGRLGVKLPNEDSYDDLMKLKGAEPWKAGPMKMAHWILVPTTFHTKKAELKKWVVKAHEQCSVLDPKKKKPTVSKKKISTKSKSKGK